ncbi:DNA cytosine methyltransferase [Dyadobacter diqingensis]|uniref:DNA cytosine methyltransferase n=1 Tax=Dyadobacter diqingensis TaxID=2938121 RepID=UPI0035B60798
MMDTDMTSTRLVHASVCTGIGGFDLAAYRVGWENRFQCEIDPWLRVRLRQLFGQNVRIHGDIKKLNGQQYQNEIDVFSAGFPCQPFSHSGLKKGRFDVRYLFPQVCRIAREIRSPWVVGENVAGILTDEASSEVVALLEAEGYQVRIVVLPASSVGAWHERNRVFFIGYSEQFRLERNNWRKSGQIDQKRHSGAFNTPSGGLQGNLWRPEPEIFPSERHQRSGNADRARKSQQKRDVGEVGRWYSHTGEPIEDTAGKRSQGWGESIAEKYSGVYFPDEWETEWSEVAPDLCGVGNGIPYRVDRLKALGNAIIPELAYTIYQLIDSINSKL